MKACQHAPQRNYDDPLTELLHLRRGVQTAMQTCDEEAKKDEQAVQMVDRMFLRLFVPFVAGIAVMWIIVKMM